MWFMLPLVMIKKIVRWNYETLSLEQSLDLTFKPGHLMTPQGNSIEPHSITLLLLTKKAYTKYDQHGPTRPAIII